MKENGVRLKLASNRTVRYAAGCAAFIALAASFYKWMSLTLTRMASSLYLTHGSPYLQDKNLLTLHSLSDTVIFLSYMAIAGSLTWLLYKLRQEITFAWIFFAFATFILSCGLVHALDVFLLWRNVYWLQGNLKLVTAVSSLITAVALPSLFPSVQRLLDAAKSSRLNASRFMAVMQSSHDAFYLLESVRSVSGEIVDFRFVFLNEKGAQLISGTPDSVQGHLLSVLYPFHVSHGLFAQYKQVVDSGESLDMVTEIESDLVNASWVHLQAVKVDDGLALTVKNITAHKNRQMEMADTSAQFQSLVEGAKGYALFTIDPVGQIKSWNLGAERLLGYSSADILDSNFSRLFTPAERDRDVSGRLIERALVEGRGEDESWCLLADGEFFIADLSVTPLLADGDSPCGFTVIVQDITAKRNIAIAQEELRRERMLLSENFLSHVSHELRTPLAATYFFTTNVLEGLLGELTRDQYDHLALALDNLNQLKDMVSDLLDVTSAESYKLTVAPQRTDPHMLIAEALSTCRPDAAAGNIRLTSTASTPLPFIWADPLRVRQILINLIDNAVKFTPPNGTVAVDCNLSAGDSEMVIFSVTDTGCGLLSNDLEKIFDRLVQIENSVVASRSGLGLGLYITRTLVEQHGGRTWAESQIGEGSTFFVTLPVFSLGRMCQSIFHDLDAGASVTLMTLEVGAIKAGIPAEVLPEIRNVLELSIRGSGDFLLPPLWGRETEDTFFIVSRHSQAEIASMKTLLRSELNRFVDGSELLISLRQIPAGPGDRREQLVTELEAAIERAIDSSRQVRTKEKSRLQ